MLYYFLRAQSLELISANNGEDSSSEVLCPVPIHLYKARIEIYWHCNAHTAQRTQAFDIHFCEPFRGKGHRLLLSAQVE